MNNLNIKPAPLKFLYLPHLYFILYLVIIKFSSLFTKSSPVKFYFNCNGYLLSLHYPWVHNIHLPVWDRKLHWKCTAINSNLGSSWGWGKKCFLLILVTIEIFLNTVQNLSVFLINTWWDVITIYYKVSKSPVISLVKLS